MIVGEISHFANFLNCGNFTSSALPPRLRFLPSLPLAPPPSYAGRSIARQRAA